MMSIQLSRSVRIVAGLALAGALAFAGPARAAEEMRLSGTVTIDSTQMAFIISGKVGGGVLTYKGKEYPFTIGGLGVGGIGVQQISATGEVYNLDDVADFPGTFVEVRGGVTVVEGKGLIDLKNTNGVHMALKSKAKGVALSLGADGVIVTMK